LRPIAIIEPPFAPETIAAALGQAVRTIASDGRGVRD
jgi:hypothetical protein